MAVEHNQPNTDESVEKKNSIPTQTDQHLTPFITEVIANVGYSQLRLVQGPSPSPVRTERGWVNASSYTLTPNLSAVM
jgi:hypothetical protein